MRIELTSIFVDDPRKIPLAQFAVDDTCGNLIQLIAHKPDGG